MPIDKKETKEESSEKASKASKAVSKAELSEKKKNESEKKADAQGTPTVKNETTSEKIVPLKKKKIKRNVPEGKVFVHASFNNTIVTITDTNGSVLVWSSAGAKGFKGARKGTPFAGQMAAEDAARKAIDKYGLRTVEVMVKGPGGGRESSLRALQAAGIRVTHIRDITPIPHNGCRPPKRRRV